MSHRLRFALLGAGLSVGAPLGLLVARSVESGRPSLSWFRAELARDPLSYAYVAVSTMLVFALFGLVLGRQVDRLANLSMLDPLTRLLNGRVFQERLQEEEERVARYGGPLSLLLIDLDGLKQINDRHGHRLGTDALLRVGKAIHRVVRATDLAARWGGDEFAVLAPQTAGEAAVRLGERIRAALAEDTATGVAISVSVGVATVDTAENGAAGTLWERADSALYQAKRQGRNRVMLFSRESKDRESTAASLDTSRAGR
jgi:diguanylate cyclase (GGDEF)-like protein